MLPQGLSVFSPCLDGFVSDASVPLINSNHAQYHPHPLFLGFSIGVDGLFKLKYDKFPSVYFKDLVPDFSLVVNTFCLSSFSIM